MSKYKPEQPKPYCLFLQYEDNPNNQNVIEYFASFKEAKQAARDHPRGIGYTVGVGCLKTDWDEVLKK